MSKTARQDFFVEIIKPSHYDNDGYVIQWRRAFIPSNALACVNALVEDVAQRDALGEEVRIVATPYDECHMVIRPKQIVRRIQRGGGRGIVLLAGVQSNQFPRALDLAREFREAGVPVAIGGFHVSGCLSMLDRLPPEFEVLEQLGVTVFAGEAEGRMEQLLRDAWRGELKPVYNFLNDLPDLEGQTLPFVPRQLADKTFQSTSFDAGRGCPFRCSFCTIINVQGRKSRHRSADDVEQIVRRYLEMGVNRFFITDDNMVRNKNWEAIFDRLIELREKESHFFKFILQVDTMCHKVPGFISKAARAGCSRVFIGLENVNPDNLKAAQKYQNKISEYRTMLQQWRAHGVLTIAGYILGFPQDTPESIERDIRLIQRELPVDIVEFMCLTPLPGSADHKVLYEEGTWMEPDLNSYDLEHVTTRHPRMSREEWEGIYDRAWHLYYSPEHIETLLRRSHVSGAGTGKMRQAIMAYYGCYRFENVHPLQAGTIRRRVRTSRRPGFERENPIVYYPRWWWQQTKKLIGWAQFFIRWRRMEKQIRRDPAAGQYRDQALSPNPTVEFELKSTNHDATKHCKEQVALVPLAVPERAAA